MDFDIYFDFNFNCDGYSVVGGGGGALSRYTI
jgi:hypothetical protein